MINKEKLHAFICETTRLGDEAGLVERMKATKKVSDTTRHAYERVVSRRLNLSDKDTFGGLMQGVSARSWHTNRAALLHGAAEAYGKHRKACDLAQRAGDMELAVRHAGMARRAVQAAMQIQGSERPELSSPRKTKRKTLPRSDEWQARVWSAATPTQKPAVAVLWATGCRPAEVEAGVDLLRRDRPDGRVIIEVRVPGAKVTEHSGQPMRKLAIDGDSAEGKALLDALGDRASMTVQRKAKRLNADFADLRPKTGIRVSPYSMRHQVSANLKAQFGADEAEKVAEALGHVATRSQGRYGSPRQAQNGSGVLAVKAVRTVKETRPNRRPKASAPKPAGPA